MRLVAGVVLGAVLAGPAAAQAPAWRPLFDSWDLDRDGRISWDEAWETIQRRFAAADLNHDGALTVDEWLAAQLPGRPPRPNQPPPDPQRQRDRRMAMFRALDANRDDRVTLAEIRPVAEAWFRSIDANGDNAVVPEELPRPRERQR